MKKFFSIILSLLMMCSFTLTACKNNDTPHTCSSKCSVCQLCTDEDCTDSACNNKCQGHGEEHTCESVCPICGNCQDATCQEDECEEKCAGHEQAELTAAQFVANTSNYLTDANEGISAAAAALGSSVELSYTEPFFPISPMSARATTRSSGVKLLSARMYNAGNSVVLLSDTKDEMMMCAKCGEVEVTVEQKYCDACKEAMGGQTNPKNYSTGETLEQYILFNSVARKIQLIVGATEYYTEYDFAFPNENELALIGTVKFEGELTKLLKEIEDYELSANADDFYVIEEPYYQDGTWNPDIGDFDKETGGQTLIYKTVRGFKLEGNTLITSSYTISYQYGDISEEMISEVIYKAYTMDGNNFYYEKYKMVEGQKVVVDMFDIIKEEAGDYLGDVYYVQMTLNGEEEITGNPAVYFEEAVDIADQWQRYVNEKMGTGYHTEVPTKVYLNGKIHKVDQDVMYEMYYFRDYDYAVAGYESSCYVYPIENWEEFYGEYFYEYTRGDSAPLPESWENGFDINLGANLEGMIEDSLYGEYAETLVFRASGNVQTSSEWAKYYPFELKESSATLDINDSYEIIASYAEDAVWSVSSSNEEVATVSGLTVQSGSVEGEAIITVQRNNLVRYFRVIVRNRLVTDSLEEMNIRLGTTEHAVFNAYSNQNDVLEFWSDNEEIVTVDQTGWLTAKKAGATSVWVKTPDDERMQELKVYVTPTLDMEMLKKANVEVGESGIVNAIMHLQGLGSISITYDEVLNANTKYVMYFDNLDVRVDESNGYQLCRISVNGEIFNDDVTIDYYLENNEVVWNARSVVFNQAGTYKFEFLYDIEDKSFAILEINVTVDTNLPYRYDKTTKTFFVKDYEGLLAWYEAQQVDNTANITLESDIIMPTNNFLFDLDGDGVNESNWGLAVNNYKGTFDGNAHTVYGLTMNGIEDETYVGFIYGLYSGGVVKNLTMKDSNLRGCRLGGVVCIAEGGSAILNCVNYSDYSTVNSGIYALVGGIVGVAEDFSDIVGCVNYGTITGRNKVGGICGYVSYHAIVVGCANYGTITGRTHTNGVIGYMVNNGVKACFNAGSVVSSGLQCGHAIAHRGVENCYYTGANAEYTGIFQYFNSEVNFVDGENCTFTDAIEAINQAIDEYNANVTVRCDYIYVLNTDPATSEAYPIILQEVTDAQS